MLMGYKNEVPIISSPCCYRSAKSNVLDLLLPPVLAKYRISGWEIACLGHGGLLALTTVSSTEPRLILRRALGYSSAGCLERPAIFVCRLGSPFIMF